MLIEYIMDSYRELTGQVLPAQPIVTVRATRPAANADLYEKAGMQARRQRRQRRLARTEQHSINGWTVRTW